MQKKHLDGPTAVCHVQVAGGGTAGVQCPWEKQKEKKKGGFTAVL